MSASKKWARTLFQLAALTLVLWGIYHSIRSSAAQLEQQRIDLAARSQKLLEQADGTEDPALQRSLRLEAEQLSKASGSFWRASPGGLVGAGVVYALGMIPASLFWRRCLQALEQTAPLLDVQWAYFYGNLGKYFPGKAMVIVLRLAALEKHGIKKTATSITIFMETLTMMSVGGALASVCLILLDLDWRLTLIALGLLVGTFIPASPPVLRFVLPRLQRGVEPATLLHWTQRISWPLIFRGWVMLSVTWLAFGLSLLLVLRSLPSAQFGDASHATILLSSLGACALAVVLGFVSLIPGGAGVREVVLSAVLSPIVGPIAALCSALWLRIVWLATELLMVGILAGVRTLRR